jgi:hypothetical protein
LAHTPHFQAISVMPSQTDCQLAADALYRAFMVNLIAEIEA